MQEIKKPQQQESEAGEGSKKKMRMSPSGWLRDRRIRDLVRDKRRLVEVPYTATLAHAVNALVANRVVAAPVAAPPGRWIGAGGSMILESDPATGAVRKHYIGMVTMLDVLLHIAEEGHELDEGLVDFDQKMEVPVSSVIGHSLEGLSLWTFTPNTSILDCMETFSKGVHRALVPLESQSDNVIAVELQEASSPGYRMLTQMDILSFLTTHASELKDIIYRSVGDLGAVNVDVFAVTKYATVIEAIRAMRTISLTAVPIVEALDFPGDSQILQDGKGKKLIGTFSATDLRGCPISQLQSWLLVNVMDFKDKIAQMTRKDNEKPNSRLGKLITCHPETSLAEVIEAAVGHHVHRVWVVDQEGFLIGLVSLTDMLRVIRESVLRTELELELHKVTTVNESPVL